MNVRVWRTQIDPTRSDEYRNFALAQSLQMFRKQSGFAGVLFAAAGTERAVITLWRDLAAAEALRNSRSYITTVEEIEASGFLTGESTIEVFELEAVFLEPAVLDQVIT